MQKCVCSATFFITRLIFGVQAPPHILKLYVPSLNHNMHSVNISPQDTQLFLGVKKHRVENQRCERDKMLKSKHDNYALERLKVEQVVVTERYSRDTAQWDKMRAFWHPRDEQTCVKIT